MPEVYTIGYEGETPDSFVAKLKAAGVELLIDTRWTPASRKPGFAKRSLSSRLEAEGIGYAHFKEVGTLKEWRVDYHRTHDFEQLAERYAGYLDHHMEPVGEIFALVRERRAALMCFEHEAGRCHRSVLAQRLRDAYDKDLKIIDL